MVWLIGRTVLMQVVVLGGTVLLARLLEPEDFGVYAVVQFALMFFAFFGDVGLGAALIQKKEQPSEEELSSVFCLQLVLSLIVIAIVNAGAEGLHLIWTDLPPGSVWLMRALSVGLLLTVLRVIPSILMERELLFGRLSALEVAGTVAFYVGSVVLALLNAGVWALAVGTLLQSVVVLVLALAMRPWRPSLALDWKLLRPIVRFGIPFQLKNIIGVVNGAISPVYAGAMLGTKPVGFINWAQNTAYFPLRLVEIMSRVTFPLFSRLQGQPKVFAETLGRAIQVCAIGTAFFVALFLGAGPQIIHVVFTDKWLPALPLLHIYAVAITIGFLAPLVSAALDAAGRPQIFARLSIGWTALNWLVVVLATPRWGMIGFAAGYSVHVIVGNIVVIIVMIKLIPGVRFARRIWAPLLAGGVLWFICRLVAPLLTDVPTLVGGLVASLAIFALVMFIVDRQGLRDAVAMVPKQQDGTGDRASGSTVS